MRRLGGAEQSALKANLLSLNAALANDKVARLLADPEFGAALRTVRFRGLLGNETFGAAMLNGEFANLLATSVDLQAALRNSDATDAALRGIVKR
jgi:hypothetical protein